MTFEEIKLLAFQLMGERKAHLEREKGGIYYHGERTAKTIIILRKLILPHNTTHDETLRIAALFHDIGKGIEPHAKYGAALSREALKDCIPANMLEEVCHLISLHASRSPQNNTYSDNVKLLQDADLLDHYGTFSIWMDIQYSAYTEKTLKECAFFNNDEWDSHCANSRAALNYQDSQKIFDEKIAWVNSFYQRLQIESLGDIVLL